MGKSCQFILPTMGNSTSLIITVLNEENSIDRLLGGLVSQTVKPGEIIIVDGGSTDKTIEKINKFKNKLINLKVLSYPGNRSMSRNYGVKMSKHSIILFTDAGCVPKKDWVEKIISPFKNNSIEVVSGYYEGEYKNIFEKSQLPFVLVMSDRIPGVFLPSTRSMAIKKSVFLNQGMFDESLPHNEDYAFAVKLLKNNVNIHFSKDAIVVWSPRKSLKSLAWMFTRFAIGDIQAGIIRPQLKNLAIRYLAALYIFSLIIELPMLWPAIPIMAIIFILIANIKNYRYVNDIRGLFWIPIIQLICDLSILFGSLIGLMYKISTK